MVEDCCSFESWVADFSIWAFESPTGNWEGSWDSGLNRGSVLAVDSSGPKEAISFPKAMVVPDRLLFLYLVRSLLKSGLVSHSVSLV